MNSLGLTLSAALCCVLFVIGGLLPLSSYAQLDNSFYNETCPNVHSIVNDIVANVSATDPRMPASLIRLHFHDCFVLGCEASVLLNSTDANSTIVIESEQGAGGNNNSIRGLDVVNQIKTELENACPNTVSCADILAIAAQVSSVLAGGPDWEVPLGRRDGFDANLTLANENLPRPTFNLTQLKDNFLVQGLDTTDLVALSGAHTIGRGHCRNFVERLYNFSGTGNPDPTLNTTLLQTLQTLCPSDGPGTTLTDIDQTTPDILDSTYFNNLQNQKGLFQSDQVLFSTTDAEDTIAIVNSFNDNQTLFFESFKASMIKMGRIGVLTGSDGEIRTQCNFINGNSAGLMITEVTEDSSNDVMVSSF